MWTTPSYCICVKPALEHDLDLLVARQQLEVGFARVPVGPGQAEAAHAPRDAPGEVAAPVAVVKADGDDVRLEAYHRDARKHLDAGGELDKLGRVHGDAAHEAHSTWRRRKRAPVSRANWMQRR